jgi:hypothetical protein
MSIPYWVQQAVGPVFMWLAMSGVLGYGAWKAKKNGQPGVSVVSGFLATTIFVIGALFFLWLLALSA